MNFFSYISVSSEYVDVALTLTSNISISLIPSPPASTEKERFRTECRRKYHKIRCYRSGNEEYSAEIPAKYRRKVLRLYQRKDRLPIYREVAAYFSPWRVATKLTGENASIYPKYHVLVVLGGGLMEIDLFLIAIENTDNQSFYDISLFGFTCCYKQRKCR